MTFHLKNNTHALMMIIKDKIAKIGFVALLMTMIFAIFQDPKKHDESSKDETRHASIQDTQGS